MLAVSALPTAIIAAPALPLPPIAPVNVIAPAPAEPMVKLAKAPFVPVPIAPVIVALPEVFAMVNARAAPAPFLVSTVEVNSISPPPLVTTTSPPSRTTAPVRVILALSVVMLSESSIVAPVMATAPISV